MFRADPFRLPRLGRNYCFCLDLSFSCSADLKLHSKKSWFMFYRKDLYTRLQQSLFVALMDPIGLHISIYICMHREARVIGIWKLLSWSARVKVVQTIWQAIRYLISEKQFIISRRSKHLQKQNTNTELLGHTVWDLKEKTILITKKIK